MMQKMIDNGPGWRPTSCAGRAKTPRSQARTQRHNWPHWHDAPGPAPELRASIAGRSTAKPKEEGLLTPYLWTPVQAKSHQQRSELSYNVGTYVNTLSTAIHSRTLQGAPSHLMRTVPGGFKAVGSLWCYMVGGNFVVCKGLVQGLCPANHDPENGRSMFIARLPAGHRPDKPLSFAALSRQAHDVGGHSTYTAGLVNIVINTDGWILGSSSRNVSGTIDLSVVRFCVGKGISLIDDVSLFSCELNGTRMITLQGALGERFFATHSQKPLAILPASCRAPQEMAFVCAGNSEGGFNLVMVHPSHAFGHGGEICWRDSVWNHDRIHLTGIMFEVAADALTETTLNTKWGGESQKIFVEEFQRYLTGRFGTIEDAWYQAFDTDGSGEINFTEFGIGCKKAGFVGNATRLWAALDDDRSGSISMDELMIDPNLVAARDEPTTLPALADTD